MSTLDEVGKNFYPVDPLPISRIQREASRLRRVVEGAYGGMVILNRDNLEHLTSVTELTRERIDHVVDFLEANGCAVTKDVWGGIMVKLVKPTAKIDEHRGANRNGNGKPTITMRPAGKWRGA